MIACRLTVASPRAALAVAALALCGAALAVACAPAAAATRILTQTDPRTIAALPPAGGRAVRLFHVSRGILSDVSPSASGRRIGFVQHLKSSPPRDPEITVLTERVWVMRGNGAGAHVVRTFVRAKRGRNDWIMPAAANGARSEIYSFDLSEDGRLLLLTRGGYMLGLRSNGRGLRVLPTPGYRAFDAEYAPGNGAIALHFENLRDGGGGDRNGIGVTARTGGPVRPLRSGWFPNQESLSYEPTFSADGRLIAFQGYSRARVSGNGTAIWTMRRSGLAQRMLETTNQQGETFTNPDFSPNSRSLVAVKHLPGGRTSLFTVRRDGTHLRYLARGPRATRYGFTPAWTR